MRRRVGRDALVRPKRDEQVVLLSAGVSSSLRFQKEASRGAIRPCAGLAGAVTGIREETAGLIAGQFTASRIAQENLVNLSIAANGLLTDIADNTSVLPEILAAVSVSAPIAFTPSVGGTATPLDRTLRDLGQ